jgi:hypothetical protein
MTKLFKVLFCIAIPVSMVQLLYVITELFLLEGPGGEEISAWQEDSLVRMIVYWLGGAIFAIVSWPLGKLRNTASLALAIGGVYLMLLGANGGIWSHGVISIRLTLCAVNLLLLVYAAYRMERISFQPTEVQ